jgi:hypothetical protein
VVNNFSPQTKSPLSFRFSGPDPVLPANFASHTRRRAMRVMVVVLVPVRHERLNYASHNRASIRKIGYWESVSLMARRVADPVQMLK